MSPALRWVLIRAFGPPDAPAPAPPSAREALDLARRLDQAPRIGGRHSIDALALELDARTAAAFALEHGMARRTAARLGELVATVAETAAALGVPVVLLKFAALRATGHVADGLRVAGDVDVLVPPDRAQALAGALAARGLGPTGFRDAGHHLPQVSDAEGRKLELHVHVPELRLPGTGSHANLAGLCEAGLVQRVDLAGECFAPLPEVMAAHAIGHALAHHAFSPHAYVALRMVADLVDLGVHSDDGHLGRAAALLVAGEVAPDELAAALALTARLGRADLSLLEPGAVSSPEGVLLRHFVAGRLDEDYRRALRGRGVAARVHGARSLAAMVGRALVLTDTEIDVIYGRPRSRLGYLGRRLARPFDLVRRAARYGAGHLRVRLRRRR